MGDLIRFVDSIAANPTVLLDLNDEATFSASEFNPAPPLLRRAMTSSMLTDGDQQSASVYADRSLSFRLELHTSTQDLNATAMQKLARLIDAEGGAWLMWKPIGATAPVFFRTRRADFAEVQSVFVMAAFKEIVLTVPAEPFAYGLPVTGSALVRNDPTSNTNPMSFLMPAVLGDVGAPLWLKRSVITGTLAGFTSHRSVIASLSRAGAAPAATYLDLASTPTPTAATGWAVATPSNSGYIGGSARQLTKSSGTSGQDVASATTGVAFEPGDYRVLVRAAMPAQGRLQLFAGAEVAPRIVVGTGNAAGLSWYDFGVLRLPGQHPLADLETGLVPEYQTASLLLNADIVGSGVGIFVIDGLLFIPVGLDDDAGGSFAMTSGFYVHSSTAHELYFDGQNQAAFQVPLVSGVGRAILPLAVNGGYASVRPGVENRVFLMASVWAGDNSTLSDDKTSTVTVDWLYYPRYLYARPAAS